MSSPIWEGTRVGSAFSSKNIRILSERIHIKVDQEFKTAKFIVEYTIQSDVIGNQIPLLFYAQDYKGDFLAWVDGNKVDIQNIPEKYTHIDSSPFSMFSKAFKKNNQTNGTDEVVVHWSENSAYVYKINDLKYFEPDITKGIHKISVEYTATVWTDVSGWVKEYSFRYSLTPAKFWKSFGDLTVLLEQNGQTKELTSNVGQPLEHKFGASNHWTFTKLPAEYLEFSYSPKINPFARALIFIRPLGLSILVGLFLFTLNLLWVQKYRRRFVYKKYSPIVIFGGILVPFLIILSYIFSYPLIDSIIGEAASGYHGYAFLAIVFYPVLLPVYWAIVWLLDRQTKKAVSIH